MNINSNKTSQAQQVQHAHKNGFAFISGDTYLTDAITTQEWQAFEKQFNDSLAPDGVRSRSYLKLKWQRDSAAISVAENQNYFQSKHSNVDDGGKVRTFATIHSDILLSPVMKSILHQNTQFMLADEILRTHDELTLGIHFIRYAVCKPGASYSSPAGLHVDDEPLVFVHLVSLSSNALGGDNLIANLKDQEITHVIRLSNPLDTLCLTRSVYHSVTPLGSSNEIAHRDVILFTVEPNATQV